MARAWMGVSAVIGIADSADATSDGRPVAVSAGGGVGGGGWTAGRGGAASRL